MIEHSLKEEALILSEFALVKPRRTKFFYAFMISSVFYMLFILIDFAFDFSTHSLKRFEWDLALVILSLPVLGIAFHASNKKIGWIINTIYYQFMSLISLFTLSRSLFITPSMTFEMNWRGLLLLIFLLSSTIILFSKPIRNHFKVNNILWMVILVISFSLAFVVALSILK